MKIRSQLTSPQVAVNRNVDNTVLDKIDAVNSNLTAIQLLGTDEAITTMSTLANVDWTAIEDKVDTLNELSVSVVNTLPAGSQASAELVGSTIELRIPKGYDGADGINGIDGTNGVNGYTPVKGVDYVDGVDGYTPIKGVDYVDGANGANGANGLSPIVEFSYNSDTGDIDYEIVNYTDVNNDREW